MEWLLDNLGTILITALLIVVVALIVRSLIKNKNSCSCGGGCGSCSMGCSCGSKNKEPEVIQFGHVDHKN